MKHFKLEHDGFEVIRNVIGESEIIELREAADRLACVKGQACTRNVCRKSRTFTSLSERLGDHFASHLKCVRSLLFDKTPEMNWPVAWHQDLTIAVSQRCEIPGYGPWSVKDGFHCVQPPDNILESMIAVRIHLDDATSGNGALKVVPGSHRYGRIKPEDLPLRTTVSVTCDCNAGDVLLMSPLIIHSSGRSTNPSHRRVLHFEYADGDSLAGGLEWAVT